MSASTSSAVGEYFSRLYERASDMVTNLTQPQDSESRPLLHGQSSNAEYGATTDNSIPVPKPRKVVTPIKVEAKVWFANEVRTILPLTFSERGSLGCVPRCSSAHSLLLTSTLPPITTLCLAQRCPLATLVPRRWSVALALCMHCFRLSSCFGACTATSAG